MTDSWLSCAQAGKPEKTPQCHQVLDLAYAPYCQLK